MTATDKQEHCHDCGRPMPQGAASTICLECRTFYEDEDDDL